MLIAQELEADLKWREEELAALKVATSSASGPAEAALLRGLMALLYAHFEGFCKFAMQRYLEEVNKHRPMAITLKPALFIRAVESCFAPLAGGYNNVVLKQVVAKLHQRSLERETLDAAVETSNMWPHVLSALLESMDLSAVTLDDNRLQLRSLVVRRNEIAHGKSNFVKNLAQYQPYEDAALLVMHDVAVAVYDAAKSHGWLR